MIYNKVFILLFLSVCAVVNGQNVSSMESETTENSTKVETDEATNINSADVQSIVNSIEESNIDPSTLNESYVPKQGLIEIFVGNPPPGTRRPSLFPKCALNYRLVRTQFVEYGKIFN